MVILRFPDYYGPNVTNPLMAPIFESALADKRAFWLGKLDLPHDLVYIDAAAAACALLAGTESAYGQAGWFYNRQKTRRKTCRKRLKPLI